MNLNDCYVEVSSMRTGVWLRGAWHTCIGVVQSYYRRCGKLIGAAGVIWRLRAFQSFRSFAT